MGQGRGKDRVVCCCSVSVCTRIVVFYCFIWGVVIIIIGVVRYYRTAKDADSEVEQILKDETGFKGTAYLVTYVVEGILSIILGAILLMGIMKAKPRFLKIWIVGYMLFVVLRVVLAAVTLMLWIAELYEAVAHVAFLVVGVVIASLIIYSVNERRREMLGLRDEDELNNVEVEEYVDEDWESDLPGYTLESSQIPPPPQPSPQSQPQQPKSEPTKTS